MVERDGTLIMVDDERLPLRPGETAGDALGALPHARLLSADRRDRDRDADTLDEIIDEMLASRTSERQGRADRPRRAASMEQKKREGYF